MRHIRTFLFASAIGIALASWPVAIWSQYGSSTPSSTVKSSSSTSTSTATTTAPATASSTATMTAKLVDPDKKAAKQAATVEVAVTGVQIVDPALSGEKPVAGQAHLHYQLDGGVIVATTATKLSYHGLTKGAHNIVVSLAANDHSPLGPQATLNVTVP